MRKRKLQKIQDNIILSVKYARLLEEIGDKQIELGAVKPGLGSKKKLKKGTHFIEDVKVIIKEIEKKNRSKKYSIVTNNQLNKQLDLLSKTKNCEMIKYNIAIATILDSSVNYENTDDFLETIFTAIFKDQSVLKNMQKKLYETYASISGKEQESGFVDVAFEAARLPAKAMLQKLKIVPHKIIAGAGFAADIGIDFAFKFVKSRIRAKRISKLSDDSLEYLLTQTAMYLYYAKQAMLSEVAYKKEFKTRLKEINLIRNSVTKKLYEEWYEPGYNQEKVKVLNNFDGYLIDKLEFHKR